MKDIHILPDTRNIRIPIVGVTDIRMPMKIQSDNRIRQHVTGELSLYTDLIMNQKGTHMSRLVEMLHYFSNYPMTFKSLMTFLPKVKNTMGATTVLFSTSFTYFVPKKTPISKKKNYLSYNCGVIAQLIHNKIEINFIVRVPVLSLCPCSLAISKIGAHNQRSIISLQIIPKQHDWFDTFISYLETCSSTELFSILKRIDEKYVVDRAYEKPCFVEDVVRNAYKLFLNNTYEAFSIGCKGYESIHNHNAYAQVEYNEEKLLDTIK